MIKTIANVYSNFCSLGICVGIALLCFYANGSFHQAEAQAESTRLSNQRGEIAFTTNRDGNWEIYLMNADGSDQRNLTRNHADDGSPVWSPDGSKIAFTSYRDSPPGETSIYVMDADGSDVSRLVDYSARSFVWSPDGSQIAVLHRRDDDLLEIDVRNLDSSVAGNDVYAINGIADVAWFYGQDNISLFGQNERGEIFSLNVGNVDPQILTEPVRRLIEMKVSPNGNKLAFVTEGDRSDELYVINMDGTDLRNLYIDSMINSVRSITWSPYSGYIAFGVQITGGSGLTFVKINNSSLFIWNGHASYDPAWSPDGMRIAFHDYENGGDIYVTDLGLNSRNIRRLTDNPESDFFPVWRP